MDKSVLLWLFIDFLAIIKPYFVASHDRVSHVEAVLNISYIDSRGVLVCASGHGKYGSGGPFRSASGFLVSFENQDWCNPFPSKIINGNWIALIPRGHCRFQSKIATAKSMNASAVIIYNYRHRSDDFVMLTSEEHNMVSVSVSHELGINLVSLYNAEREVQVGISVAARRTELSVGRLELMRLCFPILSIILLLGAVVLLHKYKIRRKRRRECEHKLSNLVTKVFTGGDEDDTCTICLDDYRAGQTLRVLHCRHRFHKSCVDPWILEKDTCPICKRNLSHRDAEEGNAGPKSSAAVPNVAFEGNQGEN